MANTTTPTWLEDIERISEKVIAPAAAETDAAGAFPRAAVTAMGQAGLLGLISNKEVGGLGEGHRAATRVVERIARDCASTAMVVCMHYCGTAVIEAFGSREARESVARGEHVTTLAFSEVGSRSQFWAPLSTAVSVNGGVRLDAKKSWSTSAGQADSYVWSSKPLAADGASTIWLVPAKAAGLRVNKPFDGLGLRGNCSSPIEAEGVIVGANAMLGADGQGFDIMMGNVLPYFQLMSTAVSLGLSEAALQKTIVHLTSARYEHLNQTLADQPTNRAYLARVKIKVDLLRTFLDDVLVALEGGRADAMLRVLESKAAAGEIAAEVTDLAMRLCGGAAFRKEVGVERNFRDARAANVMAPTTDALYDFIGKALTGLPLFG
ncbi:MAG TPA: acyl-CoA dehydrogenase family protein [Blastocatellia bacterium]|nr:acyl-CoA dehydrogenase family protein [Blastocatellia bacterium]